MVALSSEGIASARQIPCRIVALLCDNSLDDLVVTVRRFRSAKEVGANGHGRDDFGHTRLWEQVGSGAEVEVEPVALLDFVEILTPEEVRNGVHNEPWIHGDRLLPGWTFVAEGFVVQHPSDGNDNGASPGARLKVCQDKSWSRKGYHEDTFVQMRPPEIFQRRNCFRPSNASWTGKSHEGSGSWRIDQKGKPYSESRWASNEN